MLRKKPPKEPKVTYLPRPARSYRPESCPGHKFLTETEGLVDMALSYEVNDNSVCFNCGFYFSTWVWYSNKITTTYRKGIDNEAGQVITFLANQIAKIDDEIPAGWGDHLLGKLRDRRKKQKNNDRY